MDENERNGNSEKITIKIFQHANYAILQMFLAYLNMEAEIKEKEIVQEVQEVKGRELKDL